MPRGEQWAPVWKEAVEECPQYHLIAEFVRPWAFETSGDDSDFPYRSDYSLRKFKKFLGQVRESRGYDIEFWAPGSPFYPARVGSMMNDEVLREYELEECEFVVSNINEQAKLYGERYVLFRLEKVVEALANRTVLHTFTVREVSRRELKTVQACVFVGPPFELEEWRFKPGAVVTYSTEEEEEEEEARYTSSDDPDTDTDTSSYEEETDENPSTHSVSSEEETEENPSSRD